MITTPKIRNANLFLGIALGIATIVAFAAILSSQATIPAVNNPAPDVEARENVTLVPLSAEAFPQYRQSEWASSVLPATGVNDAEAYHLSERTMIPTQTGLTVYHLSEWTMFPVLVSFSSYLESERTLVEVPDGMTIYLNSERTRVPVLFTKYQLSEWFGE